MKVSDEWTALAQEYTRRTGVDCFCGSLDDLKRAVTEAREQEMEPEA